MIMKWLNLFKKKAKRKFNVKFVADGFMSNRYLVAEFIEEVSDFDIKKDQIVAVIYSKYIEQLKRHYKTDRDGTTEYMFYCNEIVKD